MSVGLNMKQKSTTPFLVTTLYINAMPLTEEIKAEEVSKKAKKEAKKAKKEATKIAGVSSVAEEVSKKAKKEAKKSKKEASKTKEAVESSVSSAVAIEGGVVVESASSPAKKSKKRKLGEATTTTEIESEAETKTKKTKGGREHVPWSAEEDSRIIALEKKHPRRWQKIAEVLADVRNKVSYTRNFNDIRKRFDTVLNPNLVKGEWSKEEDEKLIALVGEFGSTKAWGTTIQAGMKNRTAKQCKMRWECTLDPRVAKGGWSSEEDASLIELVTAAPKPITLSGWATIAKAKAGGLRTNKQCKRRWTKILDPDINL